MDSIYDKGSYLSILEPYIFPNSSAIFNIQNKIKKLFNEQYYKINIFRLFNLKVYKTLK